MVIDTYDGLKVSVPNVPNFFLDSGPRINHEHRSEGITPHPEPWQTQTFLKMLTSSPKILDIGAKIGWYSLIASAATVGKAKIHAFEPEPGNYKRLIDNLDVNGFENVAAWPFAIGGADGRTKLFVNQDSPGSHRLAQSDVDVSIDIDIRRLDTVMAQAEFIPDLVKIDVEGAEVMVFDGAKETFRKAGTRLAMCVKFQPEALGMNNARELIERLYAFERPMFDINSNHGGTLKPLRKRVLIEALEGCLHPRFDAHLDILVAPSDFRLDRIRPLIGDDFVQWAV